MKRTILLVALGVLAIAALFWSQRRTGPLVVSGLIEADDIRVGSRVGGRIQEVKVSEGQTVATGQPLILLEPYDLNERLAEAQATRAAAQARLTRLETGNRPEEIAQARARRDRYKAIVDRAVAGPRALEIAQLEDKLAMSQASLRNAQREVKRLRPLREMGTATSDEMERADTAQEMATAEVALARDQLALAREGTRVEDVAEARAYLAEAQAALDLMERGARAEDISEARANAQAASSKVDAIARSIAELVIAAPRDSVVDALDLRAGDLIAPNAPVITLLDPRVMWVRAYVPENRLNLSLGQPVHVRVDSFPGETFNGKVTFVARQAEFTPSNAQTPEERSKQVFRIKVALDEAHRGRLRPGMAADVVLEPPPPGLTTGARP